MNRYLLTYKAHATHRSFGIDDRSWATICAEGRRPAEINTTDPEPPLVKQALQILKSIPSKILPVEKSQCVDDILNLFKCTELDSKLSVLTYLIVRAASAAGAGIPWSAEIDYITTLSKIDCSLLLSIRIFFLTSWMHKRNNFFLVDVAGSLETSTVLDIKCLWQDLKKENTSYLDIDLLHSAFFNCAQAGISSNKVVTLERRFSDFTLNNHFMQSIKERLQLVITTTDKNGCTVKFGDFVDCSVLTKIASCFGDLNLDISNE